MKVEISYHDHSSISVEEIVRQAKEQYGEFVDVKISPSSNDPLDVIYFGLQQLLTNEQLSLLFDSGPLYSTKIIELKAQTLAKVSKELDSVIKDNEVRVS